MPRNDIMIAHNDFIMYEEEEDVLIYTDSTSVEFINESIVDYKEDLIGSRFVIKNPNAQITCGCGKSFS